MAVIIADWNIRNYNRAKNTDICPVRMKAVKRSYSHELVDAYLKKTGYGSVLEDFQDRLWIAEYEKGEFVSSPLQTERLFQIVVQGSLSIYCIRDDGSVHSIASGQKNYLIGEMEIFSRQASNVYAEANEDLACLAMAIEENRTALLENAGFLCMICESLTAKMESLTTIDAVPADLNQRILTYMKYRCSHNEIRGLERAAFHLNCSSRQLQRILNRYEEDGIVVKIGKGAYRLIEDVSDS